MATGLGVDATKDGGGIVTSGLTAQDHRKVLGALYKPGIISGAVVTTSASAMTYTVSAGVVAIQIASGEVVLAPVPATSKTVSSAGSTRTDIVYARQNFPADGNSNIIVDVGPTLPANSIQLAKFTVNIGTANTNAALRVGDRDYSIPYGAGLGVLHQWVNTYSGPMSTALLREGHGVINLPTDRCLRFSVSATLSAQYAFRFDNTYYCEHYFVPNLDNTDLVIFSTPGLHMAWGTYTWEFFVNVPAGQHTVNLGAGRMSGPGTALTHYGLDTDGYKRMGTVFRVEDAGVVI